MAILDNESKAILVESMRNSLCSVLQESVDMSAAEATSHQRFVNESATYEQLLNITFNPDRETNYLPDYVLEGAAAIIHRACLTGRKYIGPNAITEGALKLQAETGCVVTESMMDAAYNSVTRGKGLQIIGESIILAEGKKKGFLRKAQDAAGDLSKDVKKGYKRAVKMGKSATDSIEKWFKNLPPVKERRYKKAAEKAKVTKRNNMEHKRMQDVASDHKDFET